MKSDMEEQVLEPIKIIVRVRNAPALTDKVPAVKSVKLPTFSGKKDLGLSFYLLPL